MLIKKLIAHFGPATLDQSIASAISLFAGLFLMKIWSLTVFGQLALIFLIATFMIEVQRASIISPMMSLGPKIPKSKKKDYFTSLSFLNIMVVLVLAVMTAGVIFTSRYLFPKWDIASFWWMTGIFIVPRLVHEYYRRKFFVIGKPLKALTITVVRSVCLPIGIVGSYYVLEGLSLRNILVIYTVSYAISSIIGWYFSQKQKVHLATLKKIIQDHWRFGKWLFATVGVQYATNNYLILVAAAILGPAIAGGIQAAQYIMGVLSTLLSALENVVPAHTAKLFHEDGLKAMTRYLTKVGAGLLIISVVFVSLAVLVSPWLVPYLFEGEDYSLVVSLINGFAVFYVINSLTLCLVYALRAIEYTRPIFIAYAMTALLNLALAKPLINAYGGMGVIYGMIGFQILIVATYSLCLVIHQRKQI